MKLNRQRGTTLVVGLMLLGLTTLLGLAGAATAHIETQLAHNEQFRENAASAASAGVEFAISRIVTTPDSTLPFSFSANMPGSADRFEIQARFLGLDTALPQTASANLAGAHFEITSTGYSSRRAVDRQRVIVMRVDVASEATGASECEPALPGVHCHERGELVRLSWQRHGSP